MRTHLTSSTSPAQNTQQPLDDDVEKIVDDVRKPAWEKVEMISDDHRDFLLPPDILNYVRNMMEKEKEKGRIETNRVQWITVGKVIDRFFLVLLVIVMSLTTVVMFPVLASKSQV